jgi:Kef-type K+ transport system membrane component KefB
VQLLRSTNSEVTPIRTKSKVIFASIAALSLVLILQGCGSGEGSEEISRVLLGLLVALVAAKLGGELFVRMGQPSVLGELVLGIVVGNLTLFGYGGLDFVSENLPIEILAELGVILLLFQVGLESDLEKTTKVGASALLVATLGVVAPIVLGFIASTLLMPAQGFYVHLYVGVALCATSVGITARVLRDLRKSDTAESRIILGAAVLDDVMGLVLLAIMQGAITAANTGKPVEIMDFVYIVLKAVAFLVAAPLIGRKVAPKLFDFVAKFKAEDLLLVTALAICFGFSYIAVLVGLAPIVGAFAAGLVLDEAHWRSFSRRGERSVEDLIAPIAGFLVPIFFFRMGASVELTKLIHPQALLLSAALVVAALVGKQACALGVLQKGLDRLSVGIGMIPRGEVGLIFAAIGARLMLDGKPVINPEVFSALVIVVVFTTVVTPPLLKWSLTRRRTD